jgi:hypothetical protein
MGKRGKRKAENLKEETKQAPVGADVRRRWENAEKLKHENADHPREAR